MVVHLRFFQRKDGAASLIYVARYTKAKGQLDFLRLVDPKWLKGYTIRFFGAGMGETNIVSAMREAATERGLSIEIHNAVRKEDLLVEYCMSHGQIHYSSSDR